MRVSVVEVVTVLVGGTDNASSAAQHEIRDEREVSRATAITLVSLMDGEAVTPRNRDSRAHRLLLRAGVPLLSRDTRLTRSNFGCTYLLHSSPT